jgi:hypothetical protein
MKCPECGYNNNIDSDSCKKCGYDLIIFKPMGHQNYNQNGGHRTGEKTPKYYYVIEKNDDDSEFSGLIPDRYDALFYGGVGLYIFMVLISLFIRDVFLLIFAIFAIFISMYAVYLDFTKKRRSISGWVGNIIAICWIIFAWIFIIIISSIILANI